MLFVQIVGGDLDESGLFEKALVDGAQFVGVRIKTLLYIEHQNLAQLEHGLGGPVVAAHERLARAHGQPFAFRRGRVISEGLRHCGLQVEHQAVFAPSGHCVQLGANQKEQGLVALDLLDFEGGGQSRLGHFLPVAAEACGTGDPTDHLQIAQAAGGFLAVGLERVRGVLVLVVALAHLERLGDQKGARVHLFREALFERCIELAVSKQQARFEQRGLHRHVGRGLAQAVAHGADAGANLEARIPAAADEGLDGRTPLLQMIG